MGYIWDRNPWHGKESAVVRLAFLLTALFALAGCDRSYPEPGDYGGVRLNLPKGAPFDPAASGRITGQVRWNGEIPSVENFIYPTLSPSGAFEMRAYASPHHPKIDPASRGLEGAVVYLRGITVPAAKPWDLPPVSVEMLDRNIRIRKGDGEPRLVGFVRRGDSVAMQSKEAVFHSLRARGAAYFSLAFPDRDQPLSRTFDRNGIVHLSSGAGYYWASAYLFVDESPYFALTDREGRFTFDKVPTGPVEVVAWHPNRKYNRQERDPETSVTTRQTWADPHQSSKSVTVERGNASAVELTLP